MKKMNKKWLAMAGLITALAAGGSWAYFSQITTLSNPMSTKSYGTNIVEEFTPDTEWKPGVETDKKVMAQNTGDEPVVVRVKMSETWKRKGASSNYITLDSNMPAFTSVTKSGTTYTAKTNSTPGLTTGDESMVYKHINAASDKWFKSSDGYWYWMKILTPKGTADASTETLLDQIALASNVDLGSYTTSEYYVVVDESVTQDKIKDSDWQLVSSITEDTNKDGKKDILDVQVPAGKKMFRKSDSKLDPSKPGYADSDYTLTVTSEFVQATKTAVQDTWKNSAIPQALLTLLQ